MPALRYAAGLQASEVTKVVAVLSLALGQEVTCLPFAAQALAGISNMGCRESRWGRPDASACREPEGWRGLDESTSDIRAAHSADLDDHTIGSGHDYISALQAVCGFGRMMESRIRHRSVPFLHANSESALSHLLCGLPV